jgi:hypothetical protein
MKRNLERVLGIIFTFLIIAFSQISFASEEYSSACEWGTAAKSGQAAFFQHANYQGTCVIRRVGRYSNAKAMGIGNDKISSMKIGSGTQVSLCNNSNFKGRCKVYTRSMQSLGKMNDKTSSLIVGNIQKPPPARTPPAKAQLLAPSDLSIDNVTSTTVTLSWFDNSDREFGVEVHRMDPVEAKRNGATNWKFLALFQERMSDQVKGTGWRSDEDYDLSPDTIYCYRLRSYYGFDRSEVSDYSKRVCTKTTASKVKVKRR